jgi:hypothetical protein
MAEPVEEGVKRSSGGAPSLSEERLMRQTASRAIGQEKIARLRRSAERRSRVEETDPQARNSKIVGPKRASNARRSAASTSAIEAPRPRSPRLVTP